MDGQDSQDALFESLTLDVEYTAPKVPEFISFGGNPKRWNFFGRPWESYSKVRKLYQDIEYKNRDGKRHRIYGPAYISRTYEIEAWYKDGILHREDGPAYIHRHNMVWFYEGCPHRLDGPAVVEYGGPKQYWIHGQKMSAKEYKKQIKSRQRRGLIK